MKQKLIAHMLIAVAVLALSRPRNQITYQQVATIPLPGGLPSFDISWVDPASQRFYPADRTSKKGGGRIDMIDT